MPEPDPTPTPTPTPSPTPSPTPLPISTPRPSVPGGGTPAPDTGSDLITVEGDPPPDQLDAAAPQTRATTLSRSDSVAGRVLPAVLGTGMLGLIGAPLLRQLSIRRVSTRRHRA
jgi:hypothetical protein